MGFSRERFPSSMVRTYEHLCRAEGRTPRPELQERLFSIGYSVFQKTPHLYPDALEVLYSLRQTYTLVLATKGDREVQSDRIKALRLGPYFDRIYILERKTEEEYLLIVQELGIAPSQIYVIGNSVRSDINPAIRAGLRAILIPRGEWEYEKSTIQDGSIFVVNSLADAVGLIERQEHHG
jgi:putative hydrolase of the HAD superfamily